jgi:hypothetical protein
MSRLPPHRPLLFTATFKGFPAFAVATYLQRQGFATWLQSLLNVHPEQRAELSPPPPALHRLGGGGLLRSRGISRRSSSTAPRLHRQQRRTTRPAHRPACPLA